MGFAIHANALIALAAAASWGGGDFSGGMGVKAAGGSLVRAVRFVVLAHAMSLAVLLLVLWGMHTALPHGAPVIWAAVGGMTGAMGLVAFYMALSRSSENGAMGASAAVSGLLAAAIPAGVSMVIEGAPGGLRLAGFVVAAVAIWLIAAGEPGGGEAKATVAFAGNTPQSGGTVALAIFGGVAFGLYFVCLRLANPLGTVLPMAIARAGSLTLCLPVLLAMQRGLRAREGSWLAGWQWAMGVALLDTGGNMLFLAATRRGRLDVASVLASLYPAGTILLAGWHLHERPTQRQRMGMVVALAAVGMISV
jgi:drug/metabolite transporter (DMT)-like permease